MIVPKFWAEGVLRHRKKGRQVTVHRFGWSNLNLADAQNMADQRATEALQQAVSGVKLLRREPKVAYDGADGVPIREEIVEEHGETVITRNSYGALCLNTPDVLFADIDFTPDRRFMFAPFILLAGMLIFVFANGGLRLGAPVMFLATIAVAAVCVVLSMIWTNSRTKKSLAASEEKARLRISSFCTANPDWKVRIYRTPAGLRALAIHRLFSPAETAVSEFFEALHCDPVYVRMCRRQKCFRARVSPKPWRIGIGNHLRPRPGVWPVRASFMPRRKAWLESYDKKAAAFASCRFESEIGRGIPHEKALAVQRLHDRMCAAESGKPIA